MTLAADRYRETFMQRIRTLFLTSTLFAGSTVSVYAEINVVASIKPVHSLVAAMMEGVGEPGLIVEGAGSPHTYALKPSQAQMLEQADVVFWVGDALEAFLEKPVETLAANARSVELINSHDLMKLEFREGGAFEKHDHDDDPEHKGYEHGETAEASHEHQHDHDDAPKEAKADDHGHGHDRETEKTAEAEHEHDHENHAHGAFDAHIWLDPMNAKAMVHEIEETLVAVDPDNTAKYEANAEAVMAKLDMLIDEVASELEPVKDKGFIVFHDAYQYFENRFGISAAGSITVSPEVMPGAERVTEIRAKVQELGAACVFAEPQFEPKLVATVTEGTQARSGIIDPLGSTLENGAELYFELIRGMATSVKTCLTEGS